MTQLNVFKWPVTIYYEDTDVGGVVYHANYLKFFERARTEYLRKIGLNQQQLFSLNMSFVVRSLTIDFLRGAKLDDQLMVHTVVQNIRRASIEFSQELVNNNNEVLCKVLVKIACVDPTQMKPIALPEQLKLEIN
ncbi:MULTISPECIES: tol-pal system-associated acyl-CoA thioesterase [unclassified Photobacterium]|uniref:tol-pal system-associated acyl-CoA thioesterase n=1 Tax=unclassified Photobacterium TaxID=2628852 RepID=UPI000D17D2F9|nr:MULTISPECIES: tol-pal system-associated acyl-CoA thioesterase [unclassified Photobacterium]PSV39515.1 tol-pal system-associated acyl-CoA thioesterase [Photobacterium sp. GB-27]PSV46381.1 tol-pal system-associated acyl-CoA thioesterase [Photobacterium sp. GB-36]PSV55186.1 tol-pal system-associated acyl-CoA thioesterase [Photobacterium sp. GB-1]PSV59009.1 tol-pal system-associated acyl-CoA thioesterase [Photobacterium sp. GB-3]PSW75282.1 tol-pal system-associated acyl-CoA thioesterase [Photob